MYEVKQFDTWDYISNLFYGNEYHVSLLLLSNPKYSNTVVFAGGEKLIIPELDEAESTAVWRN